MQEGWQGNVQFLFQVSEEAFDDEGVSAASQGGLFASGAATPDGIARNHHTDIFDIDESVLPIGAAILAETARRYVTGEIG